VVDSKNGRYVEAIAAMNDLLAMYPSDKELNSEAGAWLSDQGEYEAAAKFFKRALEVDPNFAAVLNNIAYDFAGMHQYDQAIFYLKRYVELEPNEANPRDSLGEIFAEGRVAGRIPGGVSGRPEDRSQVFLFAVAHGGRLRPAGETGSSPSGIRQSAPKLARSGREVSISKSSASTGLAIH
jgi:tetratricopeptide (TPR) repeat protein